LKYNTLNTTRPTNSRDRKKGVAKIPDSHQVGVEGRFKATKIGNTSPHTKKRGRKGKREERLLPLPHQNVKKGTGRRRAYKFTREKKNKGDEKNRMTFGQERRDAVLYGGIGEGAHEKKKKQKRG